MIMKKIIYTLLFILLFYTLSAQTQITFTKNNGEIVLEGKEQNDLYNLKPSVSFEFIPGDKFKDISFKITDPNDSVLIEEQKFSDKKELFITNESSYLIFIDENGKVYGFDKPLEIGPIYFLCIKDTCFSFSIDTPKSHADFSSHTDPLYIYNNTYEIAKKLSELEDNCNKRLILERIGLYCENCKDNPYFEKILKTDCSQSGNTQILPSLGNIDVTYFATGLSRFLADRAKAELNETFFNGMKEVFKKDTVLKTVFPQTSVILEYIENYGYAYVLQVLKSAFETDMQNLSYNLYALKYSNNTNLQNFFATPEGKWLVLALSTVNTAKTATNPAVFLNSLTKNTDFTALKDTLLRTKSSELNVLSFVELNNLISQSLLSCEKDQVWIKPEQLDTLLKPEVFKMYLGLLLAKEQRKKIEKIYFIDNKKDTISFASILVKGHKEPEQFATLIRNAYSVYGMGNNAVKELLKNKQDAVVSPQALYEFYRTAINAVRPVAYGIAAVDTTLNTLKLDRIEKQLNLAVDLAYHIAIKRYPAAVFNAVILLDSMGKYDDKTQKSLIKYGTLIASVAGAQSSDEVKQVIEASALPVGSSAMKRNSNWSVMLNAYIGGYYGYSAPCCKKDVEINDSTKIKLDALRSFGLYAPVGFSFNTGLCGQKDDGALSLTINILELGSLVNVYLRDGDNADLPEDFKVRLIDIISPGAQLSYLFPKTPFVVFIGTNYIPKLYPTVDNSYKGGWRFQAGVAIDLPMYKIGLW
ncbi:MAG TPA: hypothetical protein DEQ30_09605 [Porphyromonadaceae bacterium]|nr:hypothetical protein [Porphyromonadaceae bacterium]